MGYSNWSDDAYHEISTPRRKMSYDDVKSKVFSSHLAPSLDPKGVKVRESRDSDDHPESNAIGVLFDVTGSMGNIPAEFAQVKLGGLMSMLVTKGVIPHPQVLLGAIGDSYTDNAPFQVGQFESGIEADECLTKIFIEGGGGQVSESYGLAHYFFARHTSIDCWEKRGKKGYLFTLGDELVHPKITRDEALRIFGDSNQEDLAVRDLIREAESRYEVFHIVVGGTSAHGNDPRILAGWKELLGERVLKLDTPQDVCEMIVATIGLCEGRSLDDVGAVLRGSGASAGSVKSVTNAIVPLKDALSRATPGTIAGSLPTTGGSGGTVRL